MNKIIINPFVRFCGIFTPIINKQSTSIGLDNRLFLMLNGELLISIENNKLHAEKDDIIYIPYGVKYTIVEEKKSVICAINFDFTLEHSNRHLPIYPLLSSENTKSKICATYVPQFYKSFVIKKSSANEKAYLQDINSTILVKDQFYKEKASALLTLFLISFMSQKNDDIYLKNSISSSQKRLFNDILTFILEHYSDNTINNNYIAKKFNYHPYYINNLFKKVCGITMHQYIIIQRIKASQILLLSSNITLEEIALQTGFSCLSVFSRCFKQIVGVSPSVYREKKLKRHS